MKRRFNLFAITLVISSLLGSCLLPSWAEAASDLNNISQVKVSLKIFGETPSQELNRRILASVQRVSEKALLGQDISQARQSKDYLEFTIQQVFNRVLTGYQVKKVDIIPNPTTNVYLELLPLGEEVETVSLSIVARDISPEFQKLINKEQPVLEKAANRFLKGLPIDTMSWSQLALEPLLEKMVVKQLPGFKTDLDFQWGRETKIVLFLQPQGQIIRDVEVNISSESFPKVFMQNWRKKAEESAIILKGLPVAFVEAHLEEMEKELREELEGNPAIKEYGLILNPEVRLGEITRINLEIESSKYIVDLKASLALGSKAPHESELKAHLGTYFHSNQEIFVETVFYPNPIKLEWSGGWAYKFNDRYRLGYSYNITEGASHIFLDHSFEKGSLKLDRNFKDKINEVTYNHPLDEYFTLSLTGNSEGETWMTLTTDL